MNRVVHYEIHVDDIERAKKFYTAAFGWECIQMGTEYGNYVVLKSGPGPDDMAKGVQITLANIGINGGMMKRNKSPKAPAGSSPNAFVCVIGVPDIDAAIGKIEAAGGTVHMPKTDIPNVGKVAYYADTEGNLFGIIQPVAM